MLHRYGFIASKCLYMFSIKPLQWIGSGTENSPHPFTLDILIVGSLYKYK